MVALVGIAVLMGAFIQRVAGLGFTLVAAPLLALVLGAWDGISLMYVFGTAACTWAAWQMRNDLIAARVARLASAAMVGVIPGVVIAVLVSDRALGLAVGALTIAACVLILAVPGQRITDTPKVQLTAGFTCGALGGMAGSGGPPLVLYGALAAVDPRSLVAAMQVTFASVGALSLLLRWGVTGDLLPGLPASAWLVAAVAVVIGDRTGSAAQPFLTPAQSRALMVSVALVGALALTWRSLG